MNKEPTDENIEDDNDDYGEAFIDEDDDSFVSVEMIKDENEEPAEGNFKENNGGSIEESKEEFHNGDGIEKDLISPIIAELIDTVASMERKKGSIK